MTDDEKAPNRFKRLPTRPDPATWVPGRDEEPLPQAIAEPMDTSDTTLQWTAPEMHAARKISDAITHRRPRD